MLSACVHRPPFNSVLESFPESLDPFLALLKAFTRGFLAFQLSINSILSNGDAAVLFLETESSLTLNPLCILGGPQVRGLALPQPSQFGDGRHLLLCLAG